MTAQFNAPPGWPAPPPGWQVPPGWRPDPSWPAPPPGWAFWVDDRRRVPAGHAVTVAMVGGAAVAVGSFLPWVSFDTAGLTIKPGVRIASAVIGVVLVALALTVRMANRPGRTVAGVFAVLLSALAALAYNGFIAIGEHGLPAGKFGGTGLITFHPNAGIIVMAAGSLVVFVATIRALKTRRN